MVSGRSSLSCSCMVLALIGLAALPVRAETAEPSPVEQTAEQGVPAGASPLSRGPDWLFVLTPTAGWLNNEITFKIKVPQGSGGEVDYQEQEITLADDGWGLGLTAVGFYRQLSLTNVLFLFPEVNSSRLIGNITYLSWSVPTGSWIEPYLGLGLVYIDTRTDIRGFDYALKDELYGDPAVGFAHFERMAIDTRVIAPFPKLGLQLDLPIQHWHLTPFYSLMYEDVRTRARGISTDGDSQAGHVEVWYADDLVQGQPPVGGDRHPAVAVDVAAFDKENPKTYLSNLVGSDFFIDFHYFMQMRGKVYYNLDHDLWTVRLIGSLLLNEWLGLTAYFEYSEKITVTNTYFLVGPAFVGLPSSFSEAIRKRRRE